MQGGAIDEEQVKVPPLWRLRHGSGQQSNETTIATELPRCMPQKMEAPRSPPLTGSCSLDRAARLRSDPQISVPRSAFNSLKKDGEV